MWQFGDGSCVLSVRVVVAVSGGSCVKIVRVVDGFDYDHMCNAYI